MKERVKTMKVQFTQEEKEILKDELNKIQRDYLDYLEMFDDDEESRNRLFVVSWLKNLITTDKIDVVTWDCDDDTIMIVDVE